jgi:hypothetical protein
MDPIGNLKLNIARRKYRLLGIFSFVSDAELDSPLSFRNLLPSNFHTTLPRLLLPPYTP